MFFYLKYNGFSWSFFKYDLLLKYNNPPKYVKNLIQNTARSRGVSHRLLMRIACAHRQMRSARGCRDLEWLSCDMRVVHWWRAGRHFHWHLTCVLLAFQGFFNGVSLFHWYFTHSRSVSRYTYQSTWGCGIVYNVLHEKSARSCRSILNTHGIVYTAHSILFQYILARKRPKSLILA